MKAVIRRLRRLCVINHANKGIEIEDIEARVAALEKGAQAAEQTR
jgi:hypothetical protein